MTLSVHVCYCWCHLQVLGAMLSLRQRLAAQHAVQDYTQIVLAGSCIGTAAAATTFLQQLEPVVAQYAREEYAEMCAAAAKAARAAGRWDGDIDPWDVDFLKDSLVGYRDVYLDSGRG